MEEEDDDEDNDNDNDNDNDEDGISGGNNGAWAGAGNNHRNKLQYTRNPEEKLHELFQEIDIDKDGFLSRYKTLLHLNLYPSPPLYVLR